MKLLVTGARGQVGWELQRSLQPLGELVALDFDSRDLAADFGKPESLAATVEAVRPDVIVNAAAHTAVDKAESDLSIHGLQSSAALTAVNGRCGVCLHVNRISICAQMGWAS